MTEPNLTLTDAAIEHFSQLLQAEPIPDLDLKIEVQHPLTPKAKVEIVYHPASAHHPADLSIDCGAFKLYIEPTAVPALAAAEIDYVPDTFGGQLSVKAPHIYGQAPTKQAPLKTRIEYIIEHEINPSLASHGGYVKLLALSEDLTAVVQFGGGCQGCGMANVTLKSNIEKTLLSQFPELKAVVDDTNHAAGTNPYY